MIKRADLVLEGGGVKGIGLLGAAVELAAQGWSFPRVAGTSAGAIVGALIAASAAAERPVSDLVTVMRELDYRRFRDGTLLDRAWVVGKGLELLLREGIYRGDYALDWVERQLEALGVRTWADLRIDDDEGTSLAPNQRYRLVVMASDLSRGQLVRLPWDFHHYGLDPDAQSVAASVRASMSIPFYFRPVELHTGPGGGGAVTMVDGGMLSNFPVEAFDRTDGRPSRWPTFGVKLSARASARMVARRVDSTADLLQACLRTLLAAHDAYHLDDEGTTSRTIFVDTLKISSVDFGIDAHAQQQLYENGRTAASDFLNRRSAAAAEPAAPDPARPSAVALTPNPLTPPDGHRAPDPTS